MLEKEGSDRTAERRGGDLRVLLANAYLEIAQLETSLVSARRIGAAVGIVMARRQLTYDDAFAELQRVSQQRRVEVRDLAEQVLYTHDLPVNPRR